MQVKAAFIAPFAALFLILAAVVGHHWPSASGFFVLVAKRPAVDLCDQRTTIVDVADARWLRVYDGPVATWQTHELEGRLKGIFRTRAQAVVFITGDGDLPFRRIAEVIDIASRQADNVAILTPAVMRQVVSV